MKDVEDLKSVQEILAEKEEYRIVSVNQHTRANQLEDKLNEHAKDGFFFREKLDFGFILLTKWR